MKLKIPPAFQVLLFTLLMWSITKITGSVHFTFKGQLILSWTIFIIGILIGVIAIYSFRKSKTTANPLNPSLASNLVITGIYKITRNPMYLGMLFILIAFAIRFGNIYNVFVLVLYVWYITIFQIKPEEEALTKLFNDEYRNYCLRVRRWI